VRISEAHDKGARPPGRGAITAFAGVVCVLALVQVLVVVAGLAGVSLGRPAAAAIAVAALALSWVFATKFPAPPGGVPSPDPDGDRPVRLPSLLVWLPGAALLAWAGWVWVELWVLARLRPPYDWDGLYYHIPAIHEWVVAGRVAFIDRLTDIPFVNFPMGVELSVFFLNRLTGATWIVNACNLWYWPLAFLAIVVIASRLGARGAWPWIAGAMVTGAPVFVSQSVSCYIDPGFAAAVMASIAASAIFVWESGGSARRWSPVLLGMTAGLALGSKGTGLPFATVVLAVSAFGAAWNEGVTRWRRWLPRVAVAGVVVLIVGGYWYVRNAAVTGNPVYPIQIKIGEKVVRDGWDHNQFNDANMPGWLERHPAPLRPFVSWLQTDAPVSGYAPIGGMGYVWLFAGLPALLYLVILAALRRYPGPVKEFVLVGALVVCLFALQPAPWWSRFTVWLHAAGLSAIAVAASHAQMSWRRSWWHSLTLMLAAAAMAVTVWESGRTLDLEWRDGRVTKAEDGAAEVTASLHARFDTSLDHILPGMADAPGFDAFFAAGRIARGPWERYGTLLGGILSMPLDKRTIEVLPMIPAQSDVDALAAAGVEWVIWDVAAAGDPPAVLTEAAVEHHAFNPAPDVNFHVLRLEQN